MIPDPNIDIDGEYQRPEELADDLAGIKVVADEAITDIEVDELEASGQGEYERLLGERNRLIEAGADPAELEMPARPLGVADPTDHAEHREGEPS